MSRPRNGPMPSDLHTQAIVLRRTNYGESDRILTLLTPEGKIAALAHGVRKEKSRLAGGIEPLTVSEVVVHQGRGHLATLTSARMIQFFNRILSDLSRFELASTFLKRLDRAAEQVTNPEFFQLLCQSLSALDRGFDRDLILAWFLLNLNHASGEELNLLCDAAGQPLRPDQTYRWDPTESALTPDSHGPISAREIKLTRFLLSNPLARATKIDDIDTILPPILELAKQIG